MKKRKWLSLILSLTFLTACEEAFHVHPYDVNVKGEHDINATNIAKIESGLAGQDTLRVAFISDTHLWLSDAKDEVADINRRGDIDFVIHCGDMTDTGTMVEFEWTRDILDGLRMPHIALIGNHDFLGTGNQVYSYMYGAMDFSVIASRVKFVCLNTNATEYDYMAAVPNFDFMEEEMTRDSSRFDRTVIVMHSPPYSDQFNNNVCKAFRRYLDFFPDLLCCIYGHNHDDDVGCLYDDDLVFYGIDCAVHRNYRIMTITPDGYEMEQVYY